MLFATVEEWGRTTLPWMSPTSSSRMLLYVVGPTPIARDKAALGVRKTLDTFLSEAVLEKAIRSYEIEDIDLRKEPERYQNSLHPMWWRIQWTEKNKHPYIPIFHNADAATNLGQTLFDMNARGIICVTRKGYENTTNQSKRETTDAIMLDE